MRKSCKKHKNFPNSHDTTEETDFNSPVTKNFALYAKWLKSNGSDMLNAEEHFAYFKGYHNNTVRPENYITRAETTEIFYRLLNEETRNKNLSFEHSFEDTDTTAWYNTAVSTMAKLGIIKGKTSVAFAPEDFITRAEAVSMINRMLDRTSKTLEDLHENMIKWSDNSDESAWYYIAIQEATNGHSYIKTTDGNEKWTDSK